MSFYYLQGDKSYIIKKYDDKIVRKNLVKYVKIKKLIVECTENMFVWTWIFLSLFFKELEKVFFLK